MNAARQRRMALQKRLEQQRNSTTSGMSDSSPVLSDLRGATCLKPAIAQDTSLTEQLQQSIKLVETQKKGFKTLTAMVFLKENSPRIVKIKADQPTQTIMSMQRNGFWVPGDTIPWFIPPYSITSVAILNAEK